MGSSCSSSSEDRGRCGGVCGVDDGASLQNKPPVSYMNAPLDALVTFERDIITSGGSAPANFSSPYCGRGSIGFPSFVLVGDTTTKFTPYYLCIPLLLQDVFYFWEKSEQDRVSGKGTSREVLLLAPHQQAAMETSRKAYLSVFQLEVFRRVEEAYAGGAKNRRGYRAALWRNRYTNKAVGEKTPERAFERVIEAQLRKEDQKRRKDGKVSVGQELYPLSIIVYLHNLPEPLLPLSFLKQLEANLQRAAVSGRCNSEPEDDRSTTDSEIGSFDFGAVFLPLILHELWGENEKSISSVMPWVEKTLSLRWIQVQLFCFVWDSLRRVYALQRIKPPGREFDDTLCYERLTMTKLKLLWRSALTPIRQHSYSSPRQSVPAVEALPDSILELLAYSVMANESTWEDRFILSEALVKTVAMHHDKYKPKVDELAMITDHGDISAPERSMSLLSSASSITVPAIDQKAVANAPLDSESGGETMNPSLSASTLTDEPAPVEEIPVNAPLGSESGGETMNPSLSGFYKGELPGKLNDLLHCTIESHETLKHSEIDAVIASPGVGVSEIDILEEVMESLVSQEVALTEIPFYAQVEEERAENSSDAIEVLLDTSMSTAKKALRRRKRRRRHAETATTCSTLQVSAEVLEVSPAMTSDEKHHFMQEEKNIPFFSEQVEHMDLVETNTVELSSDLTVTGSAHELIGVQQPLVPEVVKATSIPLPARNLPLQSIAREAVAVEAEVEQQESDYGSTRESTGVQSSFISESSHVDPFLDHFDVLKKELQDQSIKDIQLRNEAVKSVIECRFTGSMRQNCNLNSSTSSSSSSSGSASSLREVIFHVQNSPGNGAMKYEEKDTSTLTSSSCTTSTETSVQQASEELQVETPSLTVNANVPAVLYSSEEPLPFLVQDSPISSSDSFSSVSRCDGESQKRMNPSLRAPHVVRQTLKVIRRRRRGKAAKLRWVSKFQNWGMGNNGVFNVGLQSHMTHGSSKGVEKASFQYSPCAVRSSLHTEEVVSTINPTNPTPALSSLQQEVILTAGASQIQTAEEKCFLLAPSVAVEDEIVCPSKAPQCHLSVEPEICSTDSTVSRKLMPPISASLPPLGCTKISRSTSPHMCSRSPDKRAPSKNSKGHDGAKRVYVEEPHELYSTARKKLCPREDDSDEMEICEDLYSSTPIHRRSCASKSRSFSPEVAPAADNPFSDVCLLQAAEMKRKRQAARSERLMESQSSNKTAVHSLLVPSHSLQKSYTMNALQNAKSLFLKGAYAHSGKPSPQEPFLRTSQQRPSPSSRLSSVERPLGVVGVSPIVSEPPRVKHEAVKDASSPSNMYGHSLLGLHELEGVSNRNPIPAMREKMDKLLNSTTAVPATHAARRAASECAAPASESVVASESFKELSTLASKLGAVEKELSAAHIRACDAECALSKAREVEMRCAVAERAQEENLSLLSVQAEKVRRLEAELEARNLEKELLKVECMTAHSRVSQLETALTAKC